MRKFYLHCLPLVVSLAVSLCMLSGTSRAGEPPCHGQVTAEVALDTVKVYHNQAEWNCCADIVFEFSQSQDTLSFSEFETFAQGPCVCICCFDLLTMAADVSPGSYLVRVLDGVTGDVFGEVWVTVEDNGGTEPGLIRTMQSECGGWTSIEGDVSTWGRMKALYR